MSHLWAPGINLLRALGCVDRCLAGFILGLGPGAGWVALALELESGLGLRVGLGLISALAVVS